MPHSSTVTRGIRVEVESRYEPSRSRPQEGHWFFVYRIRIANEGPESVQLLSRHWVITDANGRVEEVRGPGVVGRQPVIEPGGAHEYASACPLGTPFGTMHGSYQMITASGDHFDAVIAPFALGEPYAIN